MCTGTEDATATADITLAMCMQQLTALFAEELNPVSIKAQKRVPVPPDLDLTVRLTPPPLHHLFSEILARPTLSIEMRLTLTSNCHPLCVSHSPSVVDLTAPYAG
eukprot:3008586-Pyramimonas_sp.AAC.1